MSRIITLLILLTLIVGCTSKGSVSDLEYTANFHYQNSDFEEAIISYSELIELDSTNGKYFFKRGNAFAYIDSIERSNSDYFRCTQLKYNVRDSYFNLGVNYIYYDDNQALSYFRLALEEDPNDSSILKEIALCKMRLANGNN